MRRNYGSPRPGRPVAGDRGPRRLHARARRPAPPLPGHARARAPPLLRLGRGLPLDVHRRHLRPRVPRARERARRVHPADHDAGAVRAGGARRLDRPARLRCLPAAMLLTHYSRVTEIGRLAADLQRRDRRARGARPPAEHGKPDRAARLRAGVGELVLGWARDHGAPLPAERGRASCWPLDVELNAQGLEVWLDRDRR